MRARRHGSSSRPFAALIACAWMALPSAIHFSSSASALNDADHIRAVIGTTWDKQDSKVETDPVVISGDYAVASWTQGDHGGRALLRRTDKGWSVVLCSSDPLKDAGWLVEAGLPKANAARIAQDLSAREALVPAERRAKFSLFEGVVSGDSDEHSGPSHHDHSIHDH